MAKDSSPSAGLLLLLAAAGLLSTTYGKAFAPAPAKAPQHDKRDPDKTGAEVSRPQSDVKGDVPITRAGHNAEGPSQIPAEGWWAVMKRVGAGFIEDRLMTEAAGVTFYTLLAIFPAMATLISLYGLVADPASVNQQLNNLNGVVPGGGLDIIREQVKSLTSNGAAALGFGVLFGFLTSLWSSNQGMKALFDALNVVYHEKEKRSLVWFNLISMSFTLGAILFIIVALVGIAVVPIVLSYVGLQDQSASLIAMARWPALMIVLALLLSLIYRYGPSRNHARWQWVSWGSVSATVLWLVASVGFSYYVSNFGSYNKTYGSLGAVVGFMTWIWLSLIVVLMGAELNAELEQQTERDSTVGGDKPIGTRGAFKADHKA